MMAGVGAAALEFRPDVLVVDQQALAGAVVARQLGLPWATLATTSAELADPLADWPLVAEALHGARVALQVEAGIPEWAARQGDLLFSPHLVLAFTTDALVGGGQTFPSHYHFVGPATKGRIEVDDFPWSWLDASRPAVLVSLGTVNVLEGERFFAVAATALASLPVQAVMVAPPELVPDPPGNILVRSRVPQLALLRRVQAVVSHGGHNTVCESLAAGLPLVLAPIRTDQPIVADQVVRAGCGIRVSFGRVDAAELGAAIKRALTDPALRAAADVVRRSFAASAGAAGAADHLSQLVSLAGVR
jgi:MGT family glycosyltransferase